MTGVALLGLVGVALAVYGYWPRRDRRTGRPLTQPPPRVLLRLLFDLALIPFQLVVVACLAFAPNHMQFLPRETPRDAPRGGPRKIV
jgi:hypothetical protein